MCVCVCYMVVFGILGYMFHALVSDFFFLRPIIIDIFFSLKKYFAFVYMCFWMLVCYPVGIVARAYIYMYICEYNGMYLYE